MHTILNERSVIQIEGEDRYHFLQGLLTNDIFKLKKQDSVYACLLTPQGKFFADFFIHSQENYFLIDISFSRREEIINKLQIYKLRSNVNIIMREDLKVGYFKSKSSAESVAFFEDPRKKDIGFRGYVNKEQLKNIQEENQEFLYDEFRIDNFIPEADKDLVAGESFILEYGLEKLNAIDFKKGCYVGQELIARTHYRGSIRKEIAKIICNNNIEDECKIITLGEKKLGIVGTIVYNKALALIRSEEVRALNLDDKLYLGNQEVKIILREEQNA